MVYGQVGSNIHAILVIYVHCLWQSYGLRVGLNEGLWDGLWDGLRDGLRDGLWDGLWIGSLVRLNDGL
jgi:hypothetical protein